MSMFSTILGKIFSHAPAPTAGNAPTSAPADSTFGGASASGSAAPATGSTPPALATSAPSNPAAPAQPVDVTAILNDLQAKSSEKLNWKQSIVDMMGLLGMDNSLTARKHLATELGYTGDESDSATMNIWLHKEVMKKLAENGGKVPAELVS